MHRRCLTSILSLSLLLSLAACGGGESTTSDAPITIGMVGPYSGPVATVGLAAQQGATAYIQDVNASGGVNGRRIEIRGYDDKYTVGETVAAVRRLVQQDKVFALVASPVGGPHTQAIAEFAGSRNLPVIGPFQGLPELNKEPTVFPTWATIRDQMYAVADHMYKKKGVKKLAVMYYNDSSGEATRAGTEAAAKANGTEILELIPFEASATDLSAEIQKARSAGADGVIIMAGTGQVATAMKEAADQRWSPQWGGHTTISDPALAELAGEAAEGAVGAAIFNTAKEDSPEMAAYHASIAKHYPDVTPTSFHLSGYTAAVLFVEALRRIEGEPTPQKLLQVLESGEEFETGTLPGLVYRPGDHVGNRLVQIVQVKDGTPVVEVPWTEVAGT